MGTFELTDPDVAWLRSCHPSLRFDPVAGNITGELSFCASYDRDGGRLHIEGREIDGRLRDMDRFICDAFEIQIRLDSESESFRGWPRVYLVGGRAESIAMSQGVGLYDLHVEVDRACCLGIRYAPERDRTLERFLTELVTPFLYRLSYTDRYGIEATGKDLWGEYAHGDAGERQHRRAMADFARRSEGRNRPCVCGSGIKYKRCCLPEVEAASRIALPPENGEALRRSHRTLVARQDSQRDSTGVVCE